MAQIAHAPNTSPKAKLVKLADKLYNIRDLERCLPKGWTETRRNEYFEWAAKCVKGLRGQNETIEKELDVVFERQGVLHLAK